MSFGLCLAVGAAAGVLASMGLGGGFILVVYLALFSRLDQYAVQVINLLFFIPVTLFALVFHIKNRLIDTAAALGCAAFGILSVGAGFYLGRYLGSEGLRSAFACFVILCGLKDLLGAAETGQS